jgi:hypothetical protein
MQTERFATQTRFIGNGIDRLPVSDEHEGLVALRLRGELAFLMVGPELRGGLFPSPPAHHGLVRPAGISADRPARVSRPVETAA